MGNSIGALSISLQIILSFLWKVLAKMVNSTDAILGTVLIISGFILAAYNLYRIVKQHSKDYSSILLSENLILISIGIAFLSKSLYELNPLNIQMNKMQRYIEDINNDNIKCNFASVIMSYGPIIISFVNSFISLIIDSYMYYRKIEAKPEDDNVIREINEEIPERKNEIKIFFKKYYAYAAILGQWVTPIILMFLMYPITMKEQIVSVHNLPNNMQDTCLTMLNMKMNNSCNTTYTQELRKYVPQNYLNVIENAQYDANKTSQVNLVVQRIYDIINSSRESKSIQDCMKICYLDTKLLTVYLFTIIIVTYLLPIMLSIIILTRIHSIDNKKMNTMNVNQDFLYNVLFWSPVMFDLILSLTFCSYEMNGTRTSLLTVAANIFQVIKNFVNIKKLQHSTVKPL